MSDGQNKQVVKILILLIEDQQDKFQKNNQHNRRLHWDKKTIKLSEILLTL